MSNIYIQEPHPSGKVILHTSMGDVSVELWCREAPKACRNFIQLCMEGYYDNTIFHRVVADFIVQGGDPSGTGEGGESIYGEPFEDEFHTRLRFVRRGLVAMANAGKNDNASQFFFTLDAAPELTNKHTIFGRVEGDTIFNVLKMGELEVDDNERPLYPPRIKTTEIILNPFDDIAPRISDRERLIAEAAARAKEPAKKKKKETKKLNLLSFGEEGAQEFEPSEEMAQQKRKNNTSQGLLEVEEDIQAPKVDQKKASLNEAKKSVSRISTERSEPSHSTRNEADSFDQQMREKVLNMSREKNTKESASQDPTRDRQEEIRRLQQDIKNLNHDTADERRKEEEAKKKVKKVSLIESERAKYKRTNKAIVGGIKGRKRSQVGNDDDTFKKFQAFQSKLLSAETTEPSGKDAAETEKVCSIHGIPNCESCFDTFGEEGDGDNDEGWMAHKLVFAKDLKGKDLMQRRDNLDDYVVIDPRQRQAEATANDMDKRQKAKEKRLGEAFRKRDRDDHRSGRDHGRSRHRDSDDRRDGDQKRSRRDYDDRRR
ncbi:cyclophilin-like domain-containing protein [Umbelopsis sp. AD052]|nr:cyclophilin-like domain-containing protein [Umbelopsis sp. AD052]